MTKAIFIPTRGEVVVDFVVSSIAEKVPFKEIGLVSTAQYVHQLGEIKKRLEAKGKMVYLEPGRPNPGQVLGCDVRAAAKGECIVFVGDGRFHAIRIAVETEKPVFIAHPSGGLERIPDAEVLKHERIRHARIHLFKEAQKVGILVSTKPGQERLEEALELKKKLQKETFIFVADEIKPENLMGFDVDVWVNTACPRIAEDYFEKPVVDASDIKGII
jgi:2-(3-amino-3-carboxypropyl)histidine synthase